MKLLNKTLAVLLTVLLIITAGAVGVSAANSDKEEALAEATGITLHYKAKGTSVPTIYYWNSLPVNIDSPAYPGTQMQEDKNTGDGWYKYSFADITKINMLFIEDGKQSKELTRSSTGEYWYKDGIWYPKNPEELDPLTTDLREDTIYFVITTRFYDGDTGNNVHCWDDASANNPDTDPAWRGDFKGLIEKLDYIKALGFSAIWITPVVTNASGYDYHGYHAFDFSTVDVRYESEGATYQDLITAAHAKGMKIVQDVVFQHTGNFGERTFAPTFAALTTAGFVTTLVVCIIVSTISVYCSICPGTSTTLFNLVPICIVSIKSPVKSDNLAQYLSSTDTYKSFNADGSTFPVFTASTKFFIERLWLNFPAWFNISEENVPSTSTGAFNPTVSASPCPPFSTLWNIAVISSFPVSVYVAGLFSPPYTE